MQLYELREKSMKQEVFDETISAQYPLYVSNN